MIVIAPKEVQRSLAAFPLGFAAPQTAQETPAGWPKTTCLLERANSSTGFERGRCTCAAMRSNLDRRIRAILRIGALKSRPYCAPPDDNGRSQPKIPDLDKAWLAKVSP